MPGSLNAKNYEVFLVAGEIRMHMIISGNYPKDNL